MSSYEHQIVGVYLIEFRFAGLAMLGHIPLHRVVFFIVDLQDLLLDISIRVCTVCFLAINDPTNRKRYEKEHKDRPHSFFSFPNFSVVAVLKISRRAVSDQRCLMSHKAPMAVELYINACESPGSLVDAAVVIHDRASNTGHHGSVSVNVEPVVALTERVVFDAPRNELF